MTVAAAIKLRDSRSPQLDPLSPPLKWAGGKRWLLPIVAQYWKSPFRLVEPFCGGLAIVLGLRPQHALLNDINPHLINFYRWLRRGLTITIEMENNEALFYTHRDRFNTLLDKGKHTSKEAASLFYYLNRTGYNGLCRFNSKGQFNVPFGRYKTISYIRSFAPYKKMLAAWQFENERFNNLELRPDDFVYADPPYDVEFTHYSKNGFSWEEQIRTAKWLARHSGPVVLSNQATTRILDLYSRLKYRLIYLDGPRRISCNGDRRPAHEVLALRNL